MRYAVNASVVVGNDQQCDLTLIQPQISPFHAIFTLDRNTLYGQDMGSGPGTLLNGDALKGKQPLHHGDVIKLYNNKFSITEGYFRSNSADELVRQIRPGSDAHFKHSMRSTNDVQPAKLSQIKKGISL
ncbi:MAG: pSer/pThr/pTyr-binding forkhead associated (FHA) protein [Alcanivorax sp.]|jgi:pSer/pThr/pTyr-binding forkhead associated (FHA) protein